MDQSNDLERLAKAIIRFWLDNPLVMLEMHKFKEEYEKKGKLSQLELKDLELRVLGLLKSAVEER